MNMVNETFTRVDIKSLKDRNAPKKECICVTEANDV
jgi:hypothetical protein